MAVWLVRHGEPERDPLVKQYIGITDLPISEAGLRQASELAVQFRQELGARASEVRLWTSPLQRCSETARILRETLGCAAPSVCPDLHEIDLGTWDGKAIAEIRSEFPEAYEERGRDLWNYHTPGGESFREAGERFCGALKEILREEPLADVIIVCHAGVIRAGMTLLTGEPFEEWLRREIPYAGRVFLPEQHIF